MANHQINFKTRKKIIESNRNRKLMIWKLIQYNSFMMWQRTVTMNWKMLIKMINGTNLSLKKVLKKIR